MKNISICMLCISMYSVNSMDIKKGVWDDIHNNKNLEDAFYSSKSKELITQSPSRSRLAIFVSFTEKIDQIEEQRRLELQQKDEKKRKLASEIQAFISARNCNKRKTYPQCHYILHNNNGIITEIKHKQDPTCFNAKDVRGVRIDDNFSIEILFG